VARDAEIAKLTKLAPIATIGESIGLSSTELELYGRYKAKVALDAYEERRSRPDGNLVLVSAITPTPAGEGKTTTAIGLALGLNRIGHTSIVTLREPSLGPLFGMKGGATGGGRAQVLPMEDINLHFTGDLHAVTAAHNLVAAVLDNHIFRRKEPLVDPRRVQWDRVLDVNDRSLRDVVVGLGGRHHGFPRETFFHITASSEIMAILCLSESYGELKDRISKILLGFTYDGEPVYVRDIGACGAATALLREALKPNLVQTTEATPAFVHGGPFANIAQGTCSVLSMKLALKLSSYVVTEAGFGFDLGAEKFFDIVCAKSDLSPRVVVLVATVRALKLHGGKKLDELEAPDPEAVTRGLVNLEKHLENIRKFQTPAVVALNRFHSDTDDEVRVVLDYCGSKDVEAATVESYEYGSEGAVELATKVAAAAAGFTGCCRSLYEPSAPVETKIDTVCREIYGSKAMDLTSQARADIRTIRRLGLEQLPVCIAKTQKSLSDNPKLLGRPKDFLVTVREIHISSGAGFLVPITGDILLMPGLPTEPVAGTVDIDEDGRITGLF
jgi:formate--tetrahydrofolate ligase